MWQKTEHKGGKGGKDVKYGKGSKDRGGDKNYRHDYGRSSWEDEDTEEYGYRSKGKGRNNRGGDYHVGTYEEWDYYSKESSKGGRGDDRGGGKRGCEKADRGGGKRSEKAVEKSNDDVEEDAEVVETADAKAPAIPSIGKPLNSSATAFQPSGMFGNFGMPSFSGFQLVLPPLWAEHATEDGTKYYYNSRTGLTQWERPPELDPPKPPAVEAKPEPAQATEGKGKEPTERERRNREQDKDDAQKGGGRGADRERVGRRGGDGDEGGRVDRGDRDRGSRRGGEGEEGDRGNAPRSRRSKKRVGASGEDQAGKSKGAGKDGSEFGPPGCNLFVFHLPDDWTDEELHEHFSPHGTVVSAKVMKELGTGRSRGFGFVSYEDRVSAATAIKKMQGHKILGKRLKVEFKKGETENPRDDMDDMDDPLGDDDEASKKNYHDDERLIGYLRAISAKNVVHALKESEGMGREEAAEQSGEADFPQEEDADLDAGAA
eukprot:TRINITY_DN2095_c0_g1_i2.p1 TRINITY_DN2095_c0_g1~~TRINITY_DN2095_c0_g1_i2.p1  ORF type:complete len:487 (-),score=119.55 TRINITY_DN2095_c0_g1_i2:84-1544(-)